MSTSKSVPARGCSVVLSVECHSLSSQVVVLSVSVSSQVGRVAQRRHYSYCNTSSTWTRLLSGTKTFQVEPTFSKGWKAGGGNLPSCKPLSLSLGLGCPVACPATLCFVRQWAAVNDPHARSCPLPPPALGLLPPPRLHHLDPPWPPPPCL